MADFSSPRKNNAKRAEPDGGGFVSPTKRAKLAWTCDLFVVACSMQLCQRGFQKADGSVEYRANFLCLKKDDDHKQYVSLSAKHAEVIAKVGSAVGKWCSFEGFVAKEIGFDVVWSVHISQKPGVEVSEQQEEAPTFTMEVRSDCLKDDVENTLVNTALNILLCGVGRENFSRLCLDSGTLPISLLA